MKKSFFYSLFLLFLAGVSQAGTFSGTVRNASTNAVMAGIIVELHDSTGSGQTVIDTTDANGAYSFTLPANTVSGSSFYASIYACSQYYVNHFNYTTANPNHTGDFSICAAPPPPPTTFALRGYVSLNGIYSGVYADVYLIRRSYDSLTNDYTLTAIDSMRTDSAGYYSKSYNTAPYGMLLVKAALRSNNPSYSNYLPTYYATALNWSNATTIGYNNFINYAQTNISLIAGTNPGGPGFIGGLVSQGANRGTGVGDPLANRILLLTTAAGQAVAYTRSDANGCFSFPSLPLGTYKVFGDALGKTNPQLVVTLTAASSSVSNITFKENSTTFVGQIGSLAIGKVAGALKNVSVFPNPATDYIAVSGLDAIKGTKTIQLLNLNGAVIATRQFISGQEARLAVATLPSGMYLLNVQTEEGSARFSVAK